MKKFLSLVLMLCLLMSVSAQADFIGDFTLGNPMLNLEDSSALFRYPALLQIYPNQIFGIFDNTWNYNMFGMGYKASDLLGMYIMYESNPGTDTYTFDPIGGPFAGPVFGGPYNFNFASVANIVYGGKLGGLMFGASANAMFYDAGETLNTVTYNTNTGTKIQQTGTASGFMASLNPSIAMDVAGMNLALTINANLNMTKYIVSESLTNGPKYSQSITPDLFNEIGFSVLLANEINDSTTLGAELSMNFENNGYSFHSTTNDASAVISSSNSVVNNDFDMTLGLGAKIKATEKVTFFLDLVGGYALNTPERTEYDEKIGYNVTETWTVPSLSLAANFELLTGLNFRIYASPTYEIQVVRPAQIKGSTVAPVQKLTTVDSFFVNTGVGLGYKIGAFEISWMLDGAFLNQLFLYPMTFLDLNGNAPDLGMVAQASFYF